MAKQHLGIQGILLFKYCILFFSGRSLYLLPEELHQFFVRDLRILQLQLEHVRRNSLMKGQFQTEVCVGFSAFSSIMFFPPCPSVCFSEEL